MEVLLRRSDVAVAEKLLDRPQVNALVQKGRCKGVPRGVRRDPFRDQCGLFHSFHEAVYSFVRKWRRFSIPTFSEGEEKRPSCALSHLVGERKKTGEGILQRLLIFKDRLHYLAREGYASVLLTLADYVYNRLIPVRGQ